MLDGGSHLLKIHLYLFEKKIFAILMSNYRQNWFPHQVLTTIYPAGPLASSLVTVTTASPAINAPDVAEVEMKKELGEPDTKEEGNEEANEVKGKTTRPMMLSAQADDK